MVQKLALIRWRSSVVILVEISELLEYVDFRRIEA